MICKETCETSKAVTKKKNRKSKNDRQYYGQRIQQIKTNIVDKPLHNNTKD